jgi:hypothetical protein
MRTKPDINSNPRALGAFRVQFMPASLGRVAQLEFEPEGGKMSAILKWTMALALLSGTVYAAQPPDVVGSDTEGNTAMGAEALHNLTSGYYNTASGFNALFSNTTGSNNAATGAYALEYNTTGSNNTALGQFTLEVVVAANNNTATGSYALQQNYSGDNNTATGAYALEYTSSGSDNVASGFNALYSNTTGSYNTASGSNALYSNTTGTHNTASGYEALYFTTTGIEDTGVGYGALHTNTTGKENTALGNEALYAVTTGTNNIAMGFHAGIDLTSGSNDIDIGNTGVAAESGVIRIGTAGTQTRTFVAGIENSKVTGAAVYVTSSGQLGVLASSERYKTAIAPMGANTQKLQQLRPVTFHLKIDPEGAVQYGLIAEEVDKIYPELVIRDDQGKIQGVRYDELAPMLLNEMQKQQQKLAAEDATLKLQAENVAALTAQSEEQSAEIRGLKMQLAELNDLKQELRAALRQVQSKDQLVAQR